MNQALNNALKKAHSLHIAGKAQLALQQCQKLVKRYPKNVEPYLLIATIHQSQGRGSLVADTLATAAKKIPSNLSLKLQYGDVCMQLGRYPLAAKIYQQGAMAQPSEPAWKIRMAAALQESEDTLPQALKVYQELLNQQPNDAAVYYNMGTCLKRQHQFDETVDMYRKAVELAPKDIQYRISLCNMLYEMTDFEAAVTAGEDALAVKADITEILGILYYSYKKLFIFDKSLYFAQRLVDVDGDNAVNMGALASAQIAEKQFNEALTSCDHSLKQDPTNRRVLADKSIALSFLGKKESATHIFDHQHLLSVSSIDVPAGYDSITEFNQAIIAHAEQHPKVRYDGLNHTCLGGTTSNEIFVEPLGPVGELQRIITAAAHAYRETLPVNESHLWLSHLPDQSLLNMSGWVHG